MDDQEVILDAFNSRPDEYARLNNLSVNSQGSISPLFDHIQSSKLLSDEIDDAVLPQLNIPRLVVRTEQLGVSKESLELLSRVNSLGRGNEQDFSLPTSRDTTRLKLELPLLQTDPDYDYRELTRRVKEQRKADIDLSSIPSEPLNTSNDESLDFPDSAYRYKQKLQTEIQDEKLDIPKAALHYLASILKDEWTQDKQHELEDTLSRRTRLRDLVITPPLTPRDPHEDYFVPDEEVCQIPIPSDPSTLFEDDVRKAEANLPRQDDCHFERSASLDLESSAMASSEDLPLLEQQMPKLSSLKVEGPLTPVDSLPPSSEMAIDLLGFANMVDIDQVLGEQHLGQTSVTHESVPGIFSNEALALLEDKAASARRNVEQEQLQSADAIARIEIPTIDFLIPEPEWQRVPSDAIAQLEFILKTCQVFKILPWPKNSQTERELHWSPFPSRMGRISLNEEVDDDVDDNDRKLLDDPYIDKVATSADYVWKKPGLAILQEFEEEEQLEPSSDDNDDTSIESLVRKRRLESANLDPDPNSRPALGSSVGSNQVPRDTELEPYQFPSLLLGYDDSSATSTLIANHINFHTSKRQKNIKSSFFPCFTNTSTKGEEKQKGDTKVKASIRQEASTLNSHPEPALGIPAPCPRYRPTSAPTKIIKALTLDRGVFSRLEKFYPNAEIIERDFDRWNTLAWDRNSVSRSPVVSPLAAEADVIVSPTTGVIVTTLLKAMQKPSPGHKGLAAIRERIRNVALRYEHLIVLVSEGNRIDETARDLTPSECAAYADFSGFVVGQDTNAQVYYVGGGNCTLTKWLVSFLTRYSPEAAEVRDLLIQEETLWELFLRRAGMNAYAAQAILGHLKAPDDIGKEEGGKYGLPAFIRMAPAERVQSFRGVMGGERVLRRINEVLETRWD
ncbi:hypothetical protein F5B19DRAFT_429429 [Rostrohypoxylon terebratum]|nr:hypothetical protein F5B19DRAFT_429429 [Rostrohypoxylon terebratum]